MSTTTKPRITAEEFLAMDLGEGRHELVRGEIFELTPPEYWHGYICVNICDESCAISAAGRGTVTRRRTTRRSASVTRPSGAPMSPTTARPAGPARRSARSARRSRPTWSSRSSHRAIGPARFWRRSAITSRPASSWSGSCIPSHRTVTIYRGERPDPGRLDRTTTTIEDLAELPGFRCPVAEFFD